MTFLHHQQPRKSSLPPLQQSSSTVSSGPFWRASSLTYKRTAFLVVAITSALLLLNTVYVQLSITSPSSSTSLSGHNLSEAPTPTASLEGVPSGLHTGDPTHKEDEFPVPSNQPEKEEVSYEDEDEEWRFTDDNNDEEEEEEDEGGDGGLSKYKDQQRQPSAKVIESVIPPHCPSHFLNTKTSFGPPSFTTSSTTSAEPSSALKSDEVSCRRIPSQLRNFALALCVSREDCSRGFIQIVHDVTAINSLPNIRVSNSASHDRYFKTVAGPDDFYFLLQGSQRLAVSAHLVSSDLLVNLDPPSTPISNNPTHSLVYRADFRMTLPGSIRVSGWLTYEKYRAIRENRSGIWPQWTHMLLTDPETKVSFDICPSCEMEPFLKQLQEYREKNFEQCDRMAPVRGAYWKEDLALKVYSALDTINRAPGAGAFYTGMEEEHGSGKDGKKPTAATPRLTRGWRFVPSGCTMTKTTGAPNASSQDPFMPTCDSISSPGAALRSQRSNETNSESESEYPRRRILFAGDSQVRATYNAILNHYRPIDPKHQRFAVHDEFIPGLDTLDLNNTVTTHPTPETTISRSESDTEIELVYKADQFLDFLIEASDEYLDRFDTIYLNLGQWPASGPIAGGQWSTVKLLDRWEVVIQRLDRWKKSREVKFISRAEADSLYTSYEAAVKENPTLSSGESSRVIWAGMNAFPMRTDASIRTKGDWRTNARLGYWDDWIETISQRDNGWFRRLNAWQLTFPMLDQIVDKAHFQETDAIDALKIEALYKLDLCSRMSPDIPYSSKPDASATTTTTTSTTA
ncbi:hypothetical protein BG011_007784 [Mortierella polycephala]|uniref:Uncharacterized protein n=1 Tax=Mortierella polycephala TaxID=41804 RepID=A0A9P6PSI9_9FUNG|nr:hypothetical protein BG011_007784 [Mortierella polycephala]